jgi:Fe-S-cluster-containing hydrogenase component 2
MGDGGGNGGALLLPGDGLQALLDQVKNEGFELIGPTVRDRAIVYEPIDGVDDLPAGWTDVQDGGTYRLERRRGDPSLFGFTVGPHSWKKFLHPPRLRLWKASRADADPSAGAEARGTGFQITAEDTAPPKYAFLGVRPCELAAIAIQDRVFLDGAHVDPAYRARRADAFLMVVQCGRSGGTCFCASMGTGPRTTTGFDLALTELLDADRHDFLLEIGSDRGAAIVEALGLSRASTDDLDAALEATDRTARQMGREMDPLGARELLNRNIANTCWREIAKRCLACGNCTMVCPTCFCTTVEDHTNLAGSEAERWRHWDSCFTTDFTFIHGGSVRHSTKSRYRQWITHKLASWHDQFDSAGCVGCGRCITWCPVGIDFTEEVAKLRERGTTRARASAQDSASDTARVGAGTED